MKRYFYLAASLSDLELEKKPPISFSDFLLDVLIYLSKKHKSFIVILRELIDIENIRRLLLEQNIDDRGNLSEKALDEAILAKVNLPEYAVDFLQDFDNTASRLNHFALLYSGFFKAHQKTGNEFIDGYLKFEYELRLWTSLLRAQKSGKDFKEVLQFEDSYDPLIMSMIVQSQNIDLIMPSEFHTLKNIFSNDFANPLELHKRIEKFRLQKITDLVSDKQFLVDNILGFLAKLLIIEQWQSLDLDIGLNRLTRFSKKH